MEQPVPTTIRLGSECMQGFINLTGNWLSLAAVHSVETLIAGAPVAFWGVGTVSLLTWV